MERPHLTAKRSSRPRRPRARICLRKGCGRKYQPRRWNQRYCQDPECLRQLRRWQAAQRQARRRQDEAVKAEHAATERARRQRARASSQAAAEPEGCGGAWSRSKNFLPSLCVSGRGAMKPPRSWVATRHATVARSAAGRFTGCWIVNASGFGAAPSGAAANAPSTIKPRRPGVGDSQRSPTTRPGRRRPLSGPSRRAGPPSMALPGKPASLRPNGRLRVRSCLLPWVQAESQA